MDPLNHERQNAPISIQIEQEAQTIKQALERASPTALRRLAHLLFQTKHVLSKEAEDQIQKPLIRIQELSQKGERNEKIKAWEALVKIKKMIHAYQILKPLSFSFHQQSEDKIITRYNRALLQLKKVKTIFHKTVIKTRCLAAGLQEGSWKSIILKLAHLQTKTQKIAHPYPGSQLFNKAHTLILHIEENIKTTSQLAGAAFALLQQGVFYNKQQLDHSFKKETRINSTQSLKNVYELLLGIRVATALRNETTVPSDFFEDLPRIRFTLMSVPLITSTDPASIQKSFDLIQRSFELEDDEMASLAYLCNQALFADIWGDLSESIKTTVGPDFFVFDGKGHSCHLFKKKQQIKISWQSFFHLSDTDTKDLEQSLKYSERFQNRTVVKRDITIDRLELINLRPIKMSIKEEKERRGFANLQKQEEIEAIWEKIISTIDQKEMKTALPSMHIKDTIKAHHLGPIIN